MNRCLLTYDEVGPGSLPYSARGLRRLSPRLQALEDFPYSADEQRQEATLRAGKLSIQGVQPKLSVRLSVKRQTFELIDRGGRFIVKPPNPPFPELPELEDLTMRLAAIAGIETPVHGLIRCADGSRSYLIKRFDRVGARGKLAVEDFAQLARRDRETKYDYSLERLVVLLDHCSFPFPQRAELLRRLLFNFLVGNEDMHLKNFSLITRGELVELAPAYDFLSSTVVYRLMGRPPEDIEESALPLRGRKKKLSASLWLDYFATGRLGLPKQVVQAQLSQLVGALPSWRRLIARSFLSANAQALYLETLNDRSARLQLA